MFNNQPQKNITRTDIKEIKKKFDWIVIHSVNSKIPGLSIDKAAQIVAQQIDSSPHIFNKWIQQQKPGSIASWTQVMELIEMYNQQQETAFDNLIYEQSSYQFQEDNFIVMKPSYFQIDKQKEKQLFVYYIENMAYLKLKDEEFICLVFNNKTLGLVNLNTFQPLLLVQPSSIEKTKKKQQNEFMCVLRRLDQQQSKDCWKKQINFYQKKSLDNNNLHERLDTSISFKERIDPIIQCKKDIEYLQKVVNINPWDPQLKPINIDPKMQLVRKRGQSEHQKRFQVLEQDNYKLNQSLQVTLISSKNNNLVMVLENLTIQYYLLEFDYKNGDYSFNKKYEFTLNDKIDQIAIIQNKWTRETHCLILKQKQMIVYSMPEFKLIEKVIIGQSADTMHYSKIIVVCQYDGLFSIIKENMRQNQLEQYYTVGSQKQVKFNDLKQSVSSLDYSNKYQLLIFGSMCTLVSIYDVRKNQFLHQFSTLNGTKQINQMNDKIIKVFVFDTQNQYIVLFASGYVTIWDIQRHKKIYEFMKQLSTNKNQQQYFQALFIEQKGTLLIGGFNLQSWVSKINPIEIEENILDQNASPPKESTIK